MVEDGTEEAEKEDADGISDEAAGVGTTVVDAVADGDVEVVAVDFAPDDEASVMLSSSVAGG